MKSFNSIGVAVLSCAVGMNTKKSEVNLDASCDTQNSEPPAIKCVKERIRETKNRVNACSSFFNQLCSMAHTF
jgi:hypothetical protein